MEIAGDAHNEGKAMYKYKFSTNWKNMYLLEHILLK